MAPCTAGVRSRDKMRRSLNLNAVLTLISFPISTWCAQWITTVLHSPTPLRSRAEERCLVRSGLVHLLDKLCSLAGHPSDGLGVESQTTRQKVSALAWAGFQVLANRCVKWEVEDGECWFKGIAPPGSPPHGYLPLWLPPLPTPIRFPYRCS